MKHVRVIYTGISLSLLFIAGTAFAQNTKKEEKKPQDKTVTKGKPQDKTATKETPQDKTTISEEIEVVRPYKPVLADAVKIRRNPDLNDTKLYKPTLSYSLMNKRLELNTDIRQLQAQKLASEKQADLYNNYAKAAFGNISSFYDELYISNGRDQALQTGLFVKHLSQKANLRGQQTSAQEISAFGKSIGKAVTLSGKIGYNRNALRFYGVNDTDPTLNADPAKQVFNYIEAEGEVVKNYTNNDDDLSYAAKVNGYYFFNKYDAKETAVTINGYLNKRFHKLNLGVASSLDLGNTKDAAYSYGNNIFRANPYIKLQSNNLRLTAGVNIVSEFGYRSSFHIFPTANLDLIVVPDYLNVFGELKGDVNRTSLKGLTDEVPFLNSNVDIKNSVEKFSLAGGIKGTGGPGFGYKAMISYKEVDNMPFFVSNFANFEKYDVVYDFGTTKVLGFEGEISVQVSDQIHWTGRVNLNQYTMASEQEAWLKPQFTLGSNLLYNITKKISFDAAVTIHGESKAKVYTAQPTSPYTVPDKTHEKIMLVKSFVDLGVGANYKINKQFAAFIKVNNLLNNSYQQVLYYPSYGINYFGGVTYSF